MSIFSCIKVHGGELATEHRRGLERGTIPLPKKEKVLRKRFVIRFRGGFVEEGGVFLIITKTFGPHLQFLYFCPRSPPAIFLGSSNLRQRSWQKEHKQPYSKINTAILCVFTFHSAVSICDSPHPPSSQKAFCPISQEDRVFSAPTVQMNGARWWALLFLRNHFYLVSHVFLFCCSVMRVHADPFPPCQAVRVLLAPV